MGSVVAGAGVNPADQRWGLVVAAATESLVVGIGVRGLSLRCPRFFVQLGLMEFN